MPRKKSGLHKEISTIFNGVPIPKSSDGIQPGPTATQQAGSYGPPSHLMKRTAEIPTPIKPSPKNEPKAAPKTAAIEKPKLNFDEQFTAPATEIITRSRPEWLERLVQSVKEKFFEPKPGVSPARQKAMVVLVPVLFIGMVMAFVKVVGSGPSKTAANTFKPTGGGVVAAASSITWQPPAPYPTNLRDPMKFGPLEPVTEPGQTGDFAVKGIIYSEDNPSAIIGIEIVHVGSKINGATVTKINKDSVEFEMNGKKWTQNVQ